MSRDQSTRGPGHAPRRRQVRSAPHGAPFFSSGRGTPRERSATDVVTLGAASVLLIALSLVAVPPSGFEQAVIGVIDAVPSWADIVWRLGAVSLLLWVVVVVFVAIVRRRADVVADVGLGAVTALGTAALVSHRLNGSWPSPSEILTGGPTGSIPLAMLAAGAAAGFAAAPHLARPFRRFDRVTVLAAVGCAVLLGATTPVGGLLSLLLGTAAAAAARWGLGASAGRPTVSEVTRSLAELGVVARDLSMATLQTGGVVTVDAVDEHGNPMRAKVYGRDARDAQLLARGWRGLWYRGSAPGAASRAQRVEHEAFITLLASSRGIPVPTVVVAGSDARRDSIIVVSDVPAPLPDQAGDDLDAAVTGIWQLVARLHAQGMVHHELSPTSFGLDGGRPALRDLGSVTLSDADELRQRDLAQVLVSTALMVGIERAVVAAEVQIGPDGIEAMLPYLQTAAFGTDLRRAVKSVRFDVDALRSAVAGAADVEVPDVVELRRVRPQALVTLGLIALVAFALITSLGNVDIPELIAELSGATPAWVLAALLVGQLPFISQAFATRGACPRPVPLGPLTLLQSGIAFVALAVPSTAGRLALDIRFFQRQGLPATSAVSIAAVDGFSGFLVQISLLILTLGAGVGNVQLDLSGSTVRGGSSSDTGDLALLLGILAAAVLVTAVAALALPRVRRRIAARVRPMASQALGTARSLRSPGKLLELFGGNLANQIVFATTLGLCLKAFGGSLDLGTLLVIYVASALFGGLMPVPGGVGVMVAALTAGLAASGIDPTVATATAMLFRVITFYLPPLWGWLSLRWLRRHDYL